MQKTQRILGMTLLLVGAVWMFQGIGMLKGSPMTGQSFWGWAGVVAAIAGAVLLWLSARTQR